MNSIKQLLNPVTGVLALGIVVATTPPQVFAAPAARPTKAGTAKSKKAPAKPTPRKQPTQEQRARFNRIVAKVREIVADQLAAKPGAVTTQARFVKDLGADSLDVVELIMRFEEEFEITISDQDAEKLQTVGAAINFIARKKGIPISVSAEKTRPGVTPTHPRKTPAPAPRASFYKDDDSCRRAGKLLEHAKQPQESVR